MVALLQEENARLRKTVKELASTKKSLVERTLRLEWLLAEQLEQNHHYKQDFPVNKEREATETTTVVLPPHLFMKIFAPMKGQNKPLLLKVTAKEAVDVYRIKI